VQFAVEREQEDSVDVVEELFEVDELESLQN
jgi:hypothetical protein